MRARLAASYQVGDPGEGMVSISDSVCLTCGHLIRPLLGKVTEGMFLRWDVWIAGNYEHVSKPEFPHVAIGV